MPETTFIVFAARRDDVPRAAYREPEGERSHEIKIKGDRFAAKGNTPTNESTCTHNRLRRSRTVPRKPHNALARARTFRFLAFLFCVVFARMWLSLSLCVTLCYEPILTSSI